MRRYGQGGKSSSSSSQRTTLGYILRGRYGRINYVGVTNNPERRANEHKQAGKQGILKVETGPMLPTSAKRWEARRLETYRRNHSGRNPRHNRTRSGGWLY